jgi:hypothetical protein
MVHVKNVDGSEREAAGGMASAGLQPLFTVRLDILFCMRLREITLLLYCIIA